MSGRPPAPADIPSTLKTNTNHQSFVVSRQAQIWLGVAGGIVLIGLGITLWLLCSCIRSKKRRRQGREVLDDRNSFPAWNPAVDQEVVKAGDGFEELQWDRTTAKPGRAVLRDEVEKAPRDPLVVDEAHEYGPAVGAKRGTRYYARQGGGGDSVWKRLSGRVSQIGKAY
ncbi:hypothetical protein LTR53_016845 [Teratosphaeriaceae sp. CCFEE 6253]|nr:hypothetical protein LTR53_016845 [Teratosphaeriaceae sp. CCFEE 6253]